jgi:hypothetical protein
MILIVFIGLGSNLFGQNIVIQTNEGNKSTTKDDCAYRINGICTTEDIGGVEVSRGFRSLNDFQLRFTNHNSFTVSVIYELENGNGELQTGTIILKSEETKSTKDYYYYPNNFKLIARKLKN